MVGLSMMRVNGEQVLSARIVVRLALSNTGDLVWVRSIAHGKFM